MTHSPLAETIRNIAAPLAAGLNLDIWGVEVAFGGRSLVRVYVEKQPGAPLPFPEEPGPEDRGQEAAALFSEGVSIEECAELSRLLGLSLEVEDLIPGAYVLEVSSPGLERTFFTEAQLAAAVGGLVEIQLAFPLPEVPGRRKFRGVLAAAPSEQGGPFRLLAEDCPKPDMETEIAFVFGNVKKARQVWLPPEKPLPGKARKTTAKSRPVKEPAKDFQAPEE